MMTDKELVHRLMNSNDPLCKAGGQRLLKALIDTEVLVQEFRDNADKTVMDKLDSQDKQIKKLQRFIKENIK